MTTINGQSEIYGIIGNPVHHSLSPLMHNAAFTAAGLNKVYVAFPASDGEAAVAAVRALGLGGVSVTIPHKQAVIPFLDALDPVAAKIGAVNTIVRHHELLRGFNTDWMGANRALEGELNLKGAKILLLGSGGSARAIGFGLQEAGARVVLASRSPEPGRELARILECPWVPLKDAGEQKADALVNATSVGMTPAFNDTPIEAKFLANFPVVMDIVYSPLETRLLREARAAGCRVIDGLQMLLHQGAAQFQLWTGQEAPLEVMREALHSGLHRPTAQ